MKFKDETKRLEKVTSAHGRWYGDACAAAFALELVGERWALLVARELMLGARRFSDIRASLPGISAKTLTEKLDWLERVGVVERLTMPPPAPARLYGLTEWGRGLEPVLQALGRWAVQSPLHDPALPFGPVSFLLSLRTMFDPAKAGDLDIWIAFEIGQEHYAGRLRGGVLSVHRGDRRMVAPDLRFTSSSAGDFLPVFYGKRRWEEASGPLRVEGDPVLAARFIALFGLPPRISDG